MHQCGAVGGEPAGVFGVEGELGGVECGHRAGEGDLEPLVGTGADPAGRARLGEIGGGGGAEVGHGGVALALPALRFGHRRPLGDEVADGGGHRRVGREVDEDLLAVVGGEAAPPVEDAALVVEPEAGRLPPDDRDVAVEHVVEAIGRPGLAAADRLLARRLEHLDHIGRGRVVPQGGGSVDPQAGPERNAGGRPAGRRSRGWAGRPSSWWWTTTWWWWTTATAARPSSCRPPPGDSPSR